MPSIHLAPGKYLLHFPPPPRRGDVLVYFLQMKKRKSSDETYPGSSPEHNWGEVNRPNADGRDGGPVPAGPSPTAGYMGAMAVTRADETPGLRPCSHSKTTPGTLAERRPCPLSAAESRSPRSSLYRGAVSSYRALGAVPDTAGGARPGVPRSHRGQVLRCGGGWERDCIGRGLLLIL